MNTGPIVVALDASPSSLAALEAAAVLAAHRGSELWGLFVEDQNLFRCAAYSFASEIDAVSGQVRRVDPQAIEATLEALAAEARRALEEVAGRAALRFRFVVIRGIVEEKLLEWASQAELVALGRAAGQEASLRIGSTTRRLILETSTRVLVLQQRSVLKAPVAVLLTPRDSWERPLEIAQDLARACGDGIVFFLLLERLQRAEEAWEQKAKEFVARLHVPVTIRRVVAPRGVTLQAELWKEKAGAVVASRAHVVRDEGFFQELLAGLDCPWLIV
ncbi:universal stress protein [Candidatus Methylacidithermus pantelleriae]|uniref:Putative Usp domain-containing protein n=1 Tax=Candidatus Methylacidithermus pantelleriae TaxID=2744239 RepID=A0A8J2BR29_9BACT|nr:universal stress protein [Candidatus Methylacidithermus pantelleriae]CAF0689843.1 putative Usp domain-containing protein [Candidatus Methylacidithermus pantelleriae]